MYVALWLAAALTAAIAAWAAVFAIRDRPVILVQLIVGAGVEAVLLVVAALAAATQVGGHRVGDPVTAWGYIITCLILLPAGAVWALIDRTRTSSFALVVVAVSLIVCEWRLWQVWNQ